jgi:FtsZ-interacting cell division protein ZipA
MVRKHARMCTIVLLEWIASHALLSHMICTYKHTHSFATQAAHTHTHTHTHKDTHTKAHTHAQRHTHKDTHTHTHKDTHKDTHTHTQRHTHKDTHTHTSFTMQAAPPEPDPQPASPPEVQQPTAARQHWQQAFDDRHQLEPERPQERPHQPDIEAGLVPQPTRPRKRRVTLVAQPAAPQETQGSRGWGESQGSRGLWISWVNTQRGVSQGMGCHVGL